MKDIILENIKSIKITKLPTFLGVNIFLTAFQFIYGYLRVNYLNNEIPLWYTMPWGESQLAPREYLILIPLVSLAVFIVGVVFSYYTKSKFMLYGHEIISFVTTGVVLSLTFSMLRIIHISSVPFDPLIDVTFLRLIIPFIVASLVTYVLVPKFAEYLTEKEIVTDPQMHHHPGMALSQPAARGGGLLVVAVFATLSIIYVPINRVTGGIILAALLGAIIGTMDNIQNAIPGSKLKFLENPIVRLLLQSLVVIVLMVVANIRIDFINNPFNGVVSFTDLTVSVFGNMIAPISLLITFIWILWVMNMLSWSNGIDGQYSGIIMIAGLTLGFLALRDAPLTREQLWVGIMAFILAGASFGILPHNWHPSKIIWGFEAIAAGIIFAALSILTRAKVPASMFVLLIPVMDSLVTVIRRLMQKKNPLKGDRGHLHHHLLERGWSVQRIAVFYWITAVLFGVTAIFTSDKTLPLMIFSIGGLIAFVIVILNVISLRSSQNTKQ